MAENSNFNFTGDNLTSVLTSLFSAGATLGSAAITGHYGNQSNAANGAYQNATSASGGTYVVNSGTSNNTPNLKSNTENPTNEFKMPTWGWVALVVVLIGFIVGVILWKRNKG